MAQHIFGGITEYSHQSFYDILKNLETKRQIATSYIHAIQKNIDFLTENSYWTTAVPSDFILIVNYALSHYNTSITELTDILEGLNQEVKKHHIKQLNSIGAVAQKINVDIGLIWHQQYDIKEYGTTNFYKVERIYGDTRDMAVNLSDTANIAERLNDYIGKKNPKLMQNNPWIAGSFYLFVAVIFITGIAILSKSVHWSILPIIIISSILLIGLVGILQLKNDDRISDKSFVSLIKETYKRLPLIGKNSRK